MKLIKPTAELWEQGHTIKAIWKHIARCTRVCYQSIPKNEGEDDEAFVRRVLFRHEPDNSVANHLAMLEHGTVYLHKVIDTYLDLTEKFYEKYRYNKYSKVVTKNHHFEKGGEVFDVYITTNLRVIIENNWQNDLYYLCKPTEYHEHRYTICFTTNLGVSREFNRHRVNSIAEESTRYCNYSKDKFGGKITFVQPAWIDGLKDSYSSELDVIAKTPQDGYMKGVEVYLNALINAQKSYMELIELGWIPQQAREVLPLATKTQLVHTAFGTDWQHFIKLRSDGVSGAPHPNAKVLGDKVKELLKGKTI